MKKRHEKYLSSVVAVRIEKLLRILQVTMTGESLKGALNVVQVSRLKKITILEEPTKADFNCNYFEKQLKSHCVYQIKNT